MGVTFTWYVYFSLAALFLFVVLYFLTTEVYSIDDKVIGEDYLAEESLSASKFDSRDYTPESTEFWRDRITDAKIYDKGFKKTIEFDINLVDVEYPGRITNQNTQFMGEYDYANEYYPYLMKFHVNDVGNKMLYAYYLIKEELTDDRAVQFALTEQPSTTGEAEFTYFSTLNSGLIAKTKGSREFYTSLAAFQLNFNNDGYYYLYIGSEENVAGLSRLTKGKVKFSITFLSDL